MSTLARPQPSIHTLPFELVYLLFLRLLQHSDVRHHADCYTDKLTMLFALMKTCKRWRDILVDAAEIWGGMLNTDGSLDWLRECLVRAKSAPLYFVTKGLVNKWGWRTVTNRKTMVIQEFLKDDRARRIKVMWVQLQAHDDMAPLDMLRRAAANVQHLHISYIVLARGGSNRTMDINENTEGKPQFNHSPALQTLHLTYTLHIFAGSLSFKGLRVIHLEDEKQGVSRFMTGNQCLQLLSEASATLEVLYLINVVWSCKPDEEDMRTRVRLHRLSQLTLAGEFISNILLLTRLWVPATCVTTCNVETMPCRLGTARRNTPFEWSDPLVSRCQRTFLSAISNCIGNETRKYWGLTLYRHSIEVTVSSASHPGPNSFRDEAQIFLFAFDFRGTSAGGDLCERILRLLVEHQTDVQPRPHPLEFRLELGTSLLKYRLDLVDEFIRRNRNIRVLHVDSNKAADHIKHHIQQMVPEESMSKDSALIPVFPELDHIYVPLSALLNAKEWSTICDFLSWRRGEGCPIKHLTVTAQERHVSRDTANECALAYGTRRRSFGSTIFDVRVRLHNGYSPMMCLS